MKYSTTPTVAQFHSLLVMDQSSNLSHNPNTQPEIWDVGQLVSLCEPSYGFYNPVGSVGLVYVVDTDDPDTPYVGIIMESGEDLNLIDAVQVHTSFISLGREPLSYKFISYELLVADHEKGLFLPFFQKAHRLLNGHGEV